MATTPSTMPTASGPANPSGAAGAPSQGPASQVQIVLAQMFQVLQRLAQSNPVLSAGLQKAAEGIQEAQSALISQPQPQPTQSNPPV